MRAQTPNLQLNPAIEIDPSRKKQAIIVRHCILQESGETLIIH
jgi:hypothetical protein